MRKNKKEGLVEILKKKTFLFLSMVFAAVLLLSACGTDEGANDEGNGEGGNNAEGGDDTAYTLVEDGKFTFAASGEFKPFSYMEGTEMTGYDIDVGNAVAEELGLEPVQEKYKFASIVEGVKTGRFDAAVASHTITPEREEEVAFSIPYYYSGPQIFVQPGSDIETAEDLEGKNIAVSKGSTYQNTAKEYTDDINLYDSDVTALAALEKDKHDAVITDFVTGKEAIGAGLEIEAKELLGRSEQAIAVSKDNPELLEAINAALETLRENGTLKEISQEYFGEDITSEPER
jgi:polar amino acid transport system substrate-binding protein